MILKCFCTTNVETKLAILTEIETRAGICSVVEQSLKIEKI
jgi:hypothetical protein